MGRHAKSDSPPPCCGSGLEFRHQNLPWPICDNTGLYTSDDAMLCRVFPTSLKGAALSWITKLSPNSIDSFATLVAKFETQFATSQPHHLTSIALVGIR